RRGTGVQRGESLEQLRGRPGKPGNLARQFRSMASRPQHLRGAVQDFHVVGLKLSVAERGNRAADSVSQQRTARPAQSIADGLARELVLPERPSVRFPPFGLGDTQLDLPAPGRFPEREAGAMEALAPIAGIDRGEQRALVLLEPNQIGRASW